MKTNDIRKTFLDFFAERGHRVVPSSSLVPANDPTLLFTNAGMVQFKDVFLGREMRDYRRATSSQRCVRAGGKHNDLENVGYTARHHTFFEMLGNFSFGDYFKREAILYAWELLTEVYGLHAEKLWATVYATDDEAYEVFAKDIGLPKNRIVRIGDKPGGRKYESDNFWQMADTGPCGPCAEIFYDHGPEIAGGPPGSPDAEGDRYVEIWNLVFMQYDRSADGTMTPLPAPCVDTGMGIERLAAVLQGVHSNYDTDLFKHLIAAAAKVTGAKDLQSNSLKVIADHIRATAFLIADGVIPSNEKRGYPLRLIIRRAIRHGRKLGQDKPFFYKLVAPLGKEMGDAYPELLKKCKQIEQVIQEEEHRFAETYDRGMELLERELEVPRRALTYSGKSIEGVLLQRETWFPGSNWAIRLYAPEEGGGATRMFVRNFDISTDVHNVIEKDLSHINELEIYDSEGRAARHIYFVVASNMDANGIERRLKRIADKTKKGPDIEIWVKEPAALPLSGEVAFELHDTHGFPIDLTVDIARERGIKVDMEGFEREMEKQRERARAASRFNVDLRMATQMDAHFQGDAHYHTDFLGYEHTDANAKIKTMFCEGKEVSVLQVGKRGAVVLDRTPFYAESGGQVGDTGVLIGSGTSFVVSDTQERSVGRLHIGRVREGTLKVGDTVQAQVDAKRRVAIVLNHSATHLLHAALRKLLGEHVTQKGSLVAPDRLRFDFSHPRPVTPAELAEIEDIVNVEIRRNVEAKDTEKSYDEAIKDGAMALFGEKYGDTVRVMRFGDFSTELCGGTHVARTGDIGLFKIVAESGIAAGIRRIEAVTGAGALDFVRDEERRLGEIASFVKSGREDAADRVRQLAERVRAQEKELANLRNRLASGSSGDLATQAVEVAGHKLVAARLDGADAQALRAAVDRLKDKFGSAAIVLGAVDGDKVWLAAGVTPDLAKRLPASELVNVVAEQVGGRGGGRADFAQAGGTEPQKLDAALDSVADWVGAKLASD
ncbi:MAG: alanine--tRNA ligase [Gammaproteobacteria bacterium]